MKNLTRTVVLGCGLVMITGCGAEEIASPGTGGNVTINNPPAPPPPPPPPPPSTVTAAPDCPFINDPQGLTDRNTISGPTGEYRVCQLPQRFNRSSRLPFEEGLVYLIEGQVDVGTDGGPAADASDGLTDTNVELTIDPGAILIASDASYMNINRGNKIIAQGTVDRPIVFTSTQNVEGTETDTSTGNWGGLIINGRAPVTDCIAAGAVPGSVNCEREVEGTNTPPRYGGNDPTDNSGVVSYVQLRYSGFTLANGDELQSLTTGGVGSGTQFDHILSFNSDDDGVEFFGGRVNVKHLIVVGNSDDALDSDSGVQLNAQFVIVAQRAGNGNSIIEADSNNGREETPRQDTRISNFTFIHENASASDEAIYLRGGTDYSLVNGVMVSPNRSCMRIRHTETRRAGVNAGLDENGIPVFQSVHMSCPTNPVFVGDTSDTFSQEVQDIFNAGTNNSFMYTTSLSSFINGATEDGIPFFDPTSLNRNGFTFENVGFVGAASNQGDAWWEGWTCNSATLNFGANNVGNCSSIPVY